MPSYDVNVLFFSVRLSQQPVLCFFLRKMLLLFPHLFMLIASRPCTIFFGNMRPRALRNTHSNYSTSVLVLFPSKTLPSKPFDICQFVRKYCPNANFAMLQHLMRAAKKFFFLCQCVHVCLYIGDSVCMCVCLLGLSS